MLILLITEEESFRCIRNLILALVKPPEQTKKIILKFGFSHIFARCARFSWFL